MNLDNWFIPFLDFSDSNDSNVVGKANGRSRV